MISGHLLVFLFSSGSVFAVLLLKRRWLSQPGYMFTVCYGHFGSDFHGPGFVSRSDFSPRGPFKESLFVFLKALFGGYFMYRIRISL